MNRRNLLKIGLGSGLAAMVAAGLAVASPTMAQGIAAPVAALTERENRPGGFGHGEQLDIVATALGMTEADLRAELQAGKSIADVAASKNASLDTVINAIVDARTKALAQAVADGKLTQAQADTMLSNLKLTLPGRLQTKLVVGLNHRFESRRKGMRAGAKLDIVATALGMTEADLRAELRAGKSVADIATAKNVSLDKVISAIVDAETKTLAQAVTDGKLTQAQADQRIANLKANLPALLAQKDWTNGGSRRPGRQHSDQQAPDATPKAPGA